MSYRSKQTVVVLMIAASYSAVRASDPIVVRSGREAGEERSDNGLNLKMVWCPLGKFKMGSSPTDERQGLDELQVEVELTKGFWIGKYEVTQSEWHSVMHTTPWRSLVSVIIGEKEGDRIPAHRITFDRANEFCEKLTKQERSSNRLSNKERYSLPTEAQWEYACRAGTATRYSFEEDDSSLGTYAWFNENTKGERNPQEVGTRRPNAWGLHDMHGNVSEWCLDVYQDMMPGGRDPIVKGDDRDDLTRVHRGGCYVNYAGQCRTAWRIGMKQNFDGYMGFRIVLVGAEDD